MKITPNIVRDINSQRYTKTMIKQITIDNPAQIGVDINIFNYRPKNKYETLIRLDSVITKTNLVVPFNFTYNCRFSEMMIVPYVNDNPLFEHDDATPNYSTIYLNQTF